MTRAFPERPCLERHFWKTSLLLLLSGCEGQQSALAPAGRDAEQIAQVFWIMTVAGLVIWVVVVGLALHAFRGSRRTYSDRSARALIIGGGVVFPAVVLTALLVYGMSMLPGLLSAPPQGSLQIVVTGEQWWWRVAYQLSDGSELELANEVHLPVGEPVEFKLESPDVIHSFWIPNLGGKMDMIPGRRTRLRLEPTRTGAFRGACAEYCGASHSYMLFHAIVEERPDFEQWLVHQARPAAEPTDPIAVKGREVFLSNGCSACHTIRGTSARGVVGPDLTHVGSRRTIGAGRLDNDVDGFRDWVARTEHLKPHVRMPSYGMLPAEELRALAVYLESLQ